MSEKLKILIVDDDHRMAKTLADIFKVKGFEVEVAHGGLEALKKIEEFPFDSVLTDIKMPQMNGVDFYKAIKNLQPELPVVLMTAYANDALVKEGLEAGAISVLNKPLDINLLLSFFSSLRKEHSIVLVDDDANFCKTLGDILRLRNFAIEKVSNPHKVMKALKPDAQVVLLDMNLNSINGLDVLKEIREKYPHKPVILVTGYRKEMASVIETAHEFSFYTCLYKPFQIKELLQVLSQIYHQELAKVLS